MPQSSQRTTYRHRIATLDDLPAIVAIYNSTVASRMVTADTEPVTVESRLGWFDKHQAGLRPLWVIEADDAAASDPILGWLSYSDFYGRPAFVGTAELSLYIAEAARGRGVGRYCMEQALAAAPGLGVSTLLGFIFGHNAPSLALFAQFGFDTWGHLPRIGVLDGVERDLLILGKRI
jgi:L-amino acid N-acyltransferase YncA